jgi:hypothetical protein
MRRAGLLTTLALAVMAGVAGFAQTPNFAGKWTIADPATAPQMGGLGTAATITQDATTMTVVRTTQMGELTATYKLDGSDSKNTINAQGNSIDLISKLKWDGPKLTIDTTASFDGNPVQMKMVLALDATGALVVETTRPDFENGGAPITTKTTYKKN